MIDDKKQEYKRLKTSFIQWQQFIGMALFLVVNRVYKNNHGDRLIELFYVVSYAVFLIVTVKSITDLSKLFSKIAPGKENNKMERYTYDFLKHAYVKCSGCGKELKYDMTLPCNCEFFHLSEDGKLKVNHKESEPYCCDCFLKIQSGNSDKGE